MVSIYTIYLFCFFVFILLLSLCLSLSCNGVGFVLLSTVTTWFFFVRVQLIYINYLHYYIFTHLYHHIFIFCLFFLSSFTLLTFFWNNWVFSHSIFFPSTDLEDMHFILFMVTTEPFNINLYASLHLRATLLHNSTS